MESHSTATTNFRCSDENGLIENLVSGTHPILYLERLLFWLEKSYIRRRVSRWRREEQRLAPWLLCLGTVFSFFSSVTLTHCYNVAHYKCYYKG